jgi:hypothetical protein
MLASGTTLYAYVSANPLNYSDPQGLIDVKIGGDRVSIHKNDADPWPSQPHGHYVDKPHTLDSEGNLYDSRTRQYIGRLKKKQRLIWQKALAKHALKCLPMLGPIIFIYDLGTEGLGPAINDSTWPISIIWE